MRKSQNNHIPSSDCDKIPTTWTNMKTQPELSVSAGTKLTIKCSKRYAIKSGDKVVTCNGGSNYIFTEKPVCSRPSM